MLRTTHRYLGLLLLLPMLAQGITGAILTAEPLLHSAGTPLASAQSADEIVAAARGAVGKDLRATRYLPATSVRPAEVWFTSSTGDRPRAALMVRVDPATLMTIGQPEMPGGLLELSRRMHHDFLLADHGGRSIVGWSGVGLALLALLGIPIWWPRSGQWRTAFTFSASERGFRLHRRLHGAVGIWVVAFLFVSAATGAILGFPQTVRGVLGVTPGGPPRTDPSEKAAGTADSRLDAALALAVSAAPGTLAKAVFLPAAGGPFRVVLAPRDADGVARSVTITTDATATRVLESRDSRTMPAAERALLWARDLHFGQGLGTVWRIITIATGLAMPVFAVTGGAMWLIRNRARERFAFARRATSPAGE